MTVDECFPETYCPRWFYIDSRARHRWTRGSEEVIITHVHSCILWTQLWYPCRGVTLLQTACLPGMCTYTMLLHIEQSHRRPSRINIKSIRQVDHAKGARRTPPKCWHRESRTRKRCHVRPKYFAQPFVFIISMCLKKFDTPTVIFNTRRVELVEVPSDGTVGRGPVNFTWWMTYGNGTTQVGKKKQCATNTILQMPTSSALKLG